MSSMVALAAAVVLLAAGCSREDGSVELARAEAVVGLVGMNEVDGPTLTTSKDVEYWTATGLADGDSPAVVAEIRAALRDAGFDVGATEPQPTGGLTVRATHDDIAVQVAVYDRIGVNDAPPDRRWVQVSVASSDADLAWASP